MTLTQDSTLGEAAEAYLAFCSHWKAIAAQRVRVYHFVDGIGRERKFSEVTHEDINAWTAKLATRFIRRVPTRVVPDGKNRWKSAEPQGLSPNYIRCLMVTASGLYHWLEGEGLSLLNPFRRANVKRPPRAEVHRDPFTYALYKRAVEESEKPRLIPANGGGSARANFIGGAIRVGYFTGLRIMDVARLAWSECEPMPNWVDFQRDLIVAHPSKLHRLRQKIEIPMEPELQQWLTAEYERRDHDKWVFPDMHAMGVTVPQDVSRCFTDFLGQIMPEHYLTFHSLRHGFVSRLMNKGIHPIIIGQMTGQSIATIAKYSHVSLEAKREALANLREDVPIQL